MPSAALPHVVHVSPRVLARGGIESLHALHRAWPVPQTFVSFFDREPAPPPGHALLGFSWRTPLWLMRRRFRRALARHPHSVVVHHNGWGLRFLADLDGAARRVIMLHADPGYHAPDLPTFRGLVDGAIGVTPALVTAWETALPELTPERGVTVQAPVVAPPLTRAARAGSGPRVLGFAGRLERAQKRLDRLPALLSALRARGVDFRFELLGDGALRPWLEREVGDAVTFHGWADREQYWRVLSSWDAIVFLTDHEGGPIAFFEGMAAGAVPFFPAITGSWGDVYAPQVHADCYYPPGNVEVLAENIRRTFALPEAEIAQLRARAQVLVADHTVARYQETMLGLLRRVQELPRISQPYTRRPRLADALPLGVVTRLLPDALRR